VKVGTTTSSAQAENATRPIRVSNMILRIAFLAVSTGLVFVVTRLAAIPISAFPGQEFDLGDIMIFTFAWTFGPAIGAFAGGVGSAISDASIPSPFAPFTLVVKGIEGFLAGYIAQKGSSWSMRISWILASLAMVGGYFLTNWIGLGFGSLAGAYEVPFDILQVVAGGLIGAPASRYLRNALPSVLVLRKHVETKA
jgi:uncharacterized membrane protein